MAFSTGGSRRRFQQYGREVCAANMVNGVIALPNGFLGEGLHPLWFHPSYALLEDFILRNLGRTAVEEEKEAYDSDDGMEGSEAKALLVGVVQQPKRRFHLVATPGIGKTYFGYYWFFKQANDRKRAVWRTKGKVFLYYDFSAEESFFHASDQYVVPTDWDDDIETIWLIVDGASDVIDHEGPVLQCVSPGRSGYHEFSKDVGMLCHLEAWTLDELKQCRDALNLNFSDEELALRFYYCGGLPREVLDQAKDVKALKGIMNKEVTRAPDWEEVIRHAASGADKAPASSDYLLHYRLPKLDMNMVASDRVAEYTLKFCSGYVEDLVHHKYMQQGHQKVKEFFYFCQRIPEARDNISGTFFERYVHRKLEEGGGDYKIRSLVSPNDPDTVLSLKPRGHRRIRRWEISKDPAKRQKKGITVASKSERERGEVETMFGIYTHSTTSLADARFGSEEFKGLADVPKLCFVEPYSQTFQSLDYFVTPDIMIQCTSALKHKVVWKQVLEVVQEYDRRYTSSEPNVYRLIFIVPEYHFWNFKFQSYKKENGSDYEEPQPGMERVQQWVLSFPW